MFSRNSFSSESFSPASFFFGTALTESIIIAGLQAVIGLATSVNASASLLTFSPFDSSIIFSKQVNAFLASSVLTGFSAAPFFVWTIEGGAIGNWTLAANEAAGWSVSGNNLADWSLATNEIEGWNVASNNLMDWTIQSG